MKIHIKKIKTLPDAKYPDAYLPSDYETTKEVDQKEFNPPKIGEMFYAGGFRSSLVTEIIDANTFKTENSIYEWRIVK